MAESVDDTGGGVDGTLTPPDSWEVADLEATMSRLMMSSKRECNNSSPNLITSSPSLLEFSSENATAPARSSSGGVLEDMVNSVDQFLREALQNPRERLSVLRIEQDVEKFIKDPLQQQMEFQQLPTSYLRLTAHRVAQHYSLQTTVLLDNNLPEGSGSRIIVRKTPESRLPIIRLADFQVNLPSDDSNNNNLVKVAIKQRPNKKSNFLGGSNSNSPKNNSLKSVEERKEEYNRARARIFCSSGSSSKQQEIEPRVQDGWNHGSLGALRSEEVYGSGGGADVNSGRGMVDFSMGGITSNNSRVAIFRDREVERKDPDYDRSYDRYTQRFDPGFGFNNGSYPIQPMYAPVLNYNTEFPQLGSTQRVPSMTVDHSNLSGPWVGPSSATYRLSESMVNPFTTPNHSTSYMQYPSQRSGRTFVHSHEQIHQQFAQSSQQQSEASFGLARGPR